MRYLSFIAFLLFFVFVGNAKAESYVVEYPVLNVRSCASVKCKIIGKLKQGDEVDSVQYHDKWIEIESEEGTGFVISKALRSNDSVFSTILSMILFWVAVLLGLWFVFFIYMLPSRVAANNKNANKIYWVNLWLGWVPVIWCILLLAALIGDSRED